MALRRVVVTGMGMVSPLGVTVESSWQKLVSGGSGLSRLPPHVIGSEDSGPDARLPSHVCGMVPSAFDEDVVPSRSHSAMVASLRELREGGEATAGGAEDSQEVPGTLDSRRMGRFSMFAVSAAHEAMIHAGLSPFAAGGPGVNYDGDRAGVSIGSGIGSLTDITEAADTLKRRGPSRLSPHFVPRILLNLAAGHVALQHALRGPNHCVSTACATGSHAIGDAFRLIQHGDADVMVCGGTEASLDRLSVAGFSRLRALSTSFNDRPEEASRPFDKDRDGFVIAEGCAVLVLEDLEHARARGATCLAEVRGYGLSGDAHHITAPTDTGDGSFRAMLGALRGSGLRPGDIDYINAHATSTPLGDDAEGQAIHRLLSSPSSRPPSEGPCLVSSTKGATGHLLGAAGAVEAAFTVLSIHEGLLPPTRNLRDPTRSDFVWSHVSEAGTPQGESEAAGGAASSSSSSAASPSCVRRDVKTALSNSLGFGGTNTSLLFTRPP